MTVSLIGQTVPAKIVRVSGTTLFHVAARELGSAEQWERIARLNGLVYPWIVGLVELRIPPARLEGRVGG
jgi:hypothetical protein